MRYSAHPDFDGLDRMEVAVRIWIDRNTMQTLRDPKTDEKIRVYSRRYPPVGFRVYGVRWFPHPWECRDCCRDVQMPGWKYPWHLYRHCCSAKHIAALIGVDAKELARRVAGYKHFVVARCPSCSKNAPRPANDYVCVDCRAAMDEPKQDCPDCGGTGVWHECGRTRVCQCAQQPQQQKE